MSNSDHKLTRLRNWLGGIVALVLLLMTIAWFFPWDMLRGPISRYVSDQLGRRFEITRHLDVDLGRTTTVRVDGLVLANPEWASEPFLVQATSAEFDIRLWPLLVGKVELPRVVLIQPSIGLQIEADGRRTWALSRDTSDENSTPRIGALLVDGGLLKYRAFSQGTNVTVQFAVAEQKSGAITPLPLSFKAAGQWKNEAFTATGLTSGVLQFSKSLATPFQMEVSAISGQTSLKARGSMANLQTMSGLDATFDLQGRNLADLYKLAGVVLPSTPPYKLRGKLGKSEGIWAVSQIQGSLGNSDLNGALSFDQSAAVPLLTGKLQSKLMDFKDLGPVIGVQPSNVSTASGKVAVPAKSLPRSVSSSVRKVLPVVALDLVKLQAMNADVIYSAADIRHVKELPLDKGSVHVKLNAGVLQLDPIALGLAGGTVAGSIRIDSNVTPAAYSTKLNIRGLHLNKLLPTVETSKSSLGKINGQFDLKGRGNSAAQMLGSSSGNMALLMGNGQISNLLMEFLGLDGGEVIKFLLRGDQNVELRCAAAAFDVSQGLMTSRAIVLDTADTVINGHGQVSLANETLNIVLNPEPKDGSILSFRSPLKISGTFAAPLAGPDKGALAGRAAIVVALGVINPLLALAGTIETGPGQDADCAGVLKRASNPQAGTKPVQPGTR